MKVTVFHTTHCAFCKVEMQWLDSKGIEYNHINVEEDDSAKSFLETTLGIMSVPFTTIEKDGKTTNIQGFNRPKLSDALGI